VCPPRPPLISQCAQRLAAMEMEKNALHLLLFGATLFGCSLCDEAPVAAVSKTAAPSPLVLSHLESLNTLRAAGVSCPGGLHFKPNRVPLEFDCALWRAAEFQLQHESSAGSPLPPSARTQDSLQLVQGSSSNLASAEGTLAWLKASDNHCRKIMDPAIRIVGIAYHNMPQMGKQQHTWLHAVGAAAVPGDSLCLNIRDEPAGSQVAHTNSNRRLGKGGTGNGADDPASTAAPADTDSTTAYEGPGQTFGMVLLIVSMSLFCTCTFGSIIIGNYVLSRVADQNPSEDPEPMP